MSIIGPTKPPTLGATLGASASGGALPWDAGGGAPYFPLESQIIAEFTAAGWTTYGLFLARGLDDFTLVSGDVSVWVNYGTGGNALQGTAGARPTWQATGLNSKGTFDYDGGDTLATANINIAGDSQTATVLMALFEDDDSAATRWVAEYGAIAGGRSGTGIETITDTLAGINFSTGGTASATSGAVSMATPNVVSATWDSALAASEATIRHAGADVTSTRLDNNLSAHMLATEPLMIGGRYNASSRTNGRISAVVLAAGATAIPLTQVANVEALILAEWGL